MYQVDLCYTDSVMLQEIFDAFPDRTLAEEEEAVRYLNSKLRDETVLNLKTMFVSVFKTINNGTKIIRTVLDWEYCWVLTLKHMRNMGSQAEACGYGLRETDNTKCIPPSIKPSYKTKSRPAEGRAVEKQVEIRPCYDCGMLGHKKGTCRFDKSKYFNLANTSYLGSTAHELLVAELGRRNSIPRDGKIQRILSVRGTSSNVPSTSLYAPQQPPPPSGHPPISTGYSSKPYSGNNQSRRRRGKVLSNLISPRATSSDFLPVTLRFLPDLKMKQEEMKQKLCWILAHLLGIS